MVLSMKKLHMVKSNPSKNKNETGGNLMVWFSFGSWFSCDDAWEFKDAWLCSSKSAHGLIEFKLVELKVRLKKCGFSDK